jgi:hypothetical protein
MWSIVQLLSQKKIEEVDKRFAWKDSMLDHGQGYHAPSPLD